MKTVIPAILANTPSVQAFSGASALSPVGVDGIFLDLGMSTLQILDEHRGFSFRHEDAPLDMRMDTSRSDAPTAADILNFASEGELATMLWTESNEKLSRRIAARIVEHRQVLGKFILVGDLLRTIYSVTGKWTKESIHPATRTMQALRRRVNEEDRELREVLSSAQALLAPKGGICAVLAFHSGEDRVVKRHFRNDHSWKIDADWKKPRVADAEEISRNPPSRSAKLRVAHAVSLWMPHRRATTTLGHRNETASVPQLIWYKGEDISSATTHSQEESSPVA